LLRLLGQFQSVHPLFFGCSVGVVFELRIEEEEAEIPGPFSTYT
jgi:hypothetical protein